MKYAVMFLSLAIVCSSYGMEGFINSVHFIAPAYVMAEIVEDNQPEDTVSLQNIWRSCKQWISSHMPTDEKQKEDPTATQDPLSSQES